MNSWTYYVNDLQFEIPTAEGYQTLYADVKVYASSYLYGDDADGNRGVWVTEREAEIEEVRNEEGMFIDVTDEMTMEVQTIINERGADLE